MGRKPKKSLAAIAPTTTSAAAASATISAWEEDPASGIVLTRPTPNIGKQPLAFSFPKPTPKAAIYQQGTPEFRYWTAAEALRRGADFWAPRVPLTQWQVGATLAVVLDEGEQLNAYYDRNALNFFHGASPGGTVYSGESPDIACHEMGHAILDSFKPELWGAASQEAAAFHEAFADISAILCALQLPELRADILSTTRGRLYQSSRLSRLAEQLGAAIRAQVPDAVEPDCLRNVVNSFTYQDPTTLPSSAPAAQLASEPHSFSRVFSGAFFESLATALTAKAADPASPTDAELVTVSNDLAGILVEGIKASPVVPDWYAQVAASMIIAADAVDPAYGPILKGVFVRRSILSLHSASGMAEVMQATATLAPSSATPPAPSPLPIVALSASHYGVEGMLFTEAAAQPRHYLVTAAALDASPVEPTSGSGSATAFVDDLFTRGRVDYAGTVEQHKQLEHGLRLKTHRLEKTTGGVRLHRVLFDCGFCMR